MGREADKAGQNNLHKYCFTATSGKLYCGHTVTKYHREAESYKTHIFIKVLMPDWHYLSWWYFCFNTHLMILVNFLNALIPSTIILKKSLFDVIKISNSTMNVALKLT